MSNGAFDKQSKRSAAKHSNAKCLSDPGNTTTALFRISLTHVGKGTCGCRDRPRARTHTQLEPGAKLV